MTGRFEPRRAAQDPLLLRLLRGPSSARRHDPRPQPHREIGLVEGTGRKGHPRCHIRRLGPGGSKPFMSSEGRQTPSEVRSLPMTTSSLARAAVTLVVPGLLALGLLGSSLPDRMHHAFDAVAIASLRSFSALPLHGRPRLRGGVPVAAGRRR